MAKRRFSVILLTIAALASACGGTASKASVGIDTTTSTTLSIDFAEQYLDVEALFLVRYATANAALQTAMESRKTPILIEALHTIGWTNWDFATALLAQKWPDDLRPAIQKQAKLLGDLSSWQRIATESDWTSMIEPMQHLSVGVVQAIQVTRELLGLPQSESPGTLLTA